MSRTRRLVATLPLLVLAALPAQAGPLDEPAGLPCRSEAAKDLGGFVWADPNHRISVFVAGPWRVPGATSVTIRCDVWDVNGPVRQHLGHEVNTSSGETVVLVAGPEERWMHGGDPPIVCTTVTWRAPGGGGQWPATGESCQPAGEYAVVP